MKKILLSLLLVTFILTSAFSAPKYVFLFIGDGMALPQIKAAELYLESVGSDKRLIMTSLEAQGMTTTQSADSFITDSAAAGTALATGHKTNSGVICMNTTLTETYKTVAEIAKENGKKVGIISSVSIDHATPAAFYAHQPSRKNYYEIGMEMISTGFDLYGGGALLSPKGKKGDQPDIVDEAIKAGYKVVDNQVDFEKLSSKNEKVIIFNEALDGAQAMQYEIDRQTEFSLADLTEKAINLLDNENGFFMMVEGGKIDWAAHANDAGTVIHDTLAFDDAVAKAVEFYNSHPKDTLIVVTGDHETGGLTIGFAGTQYSTYVDKIEKQTLSFQNFDAVYSHLLASNPNLTLNDLLPDLEKYFGLSKKDLNDMDIKKLETAISDSKKAKLPSTEYTYLLYGGYNPVSVTVTHILNQKSGISWTTYSHTGVPVATFAQGVYSSLFNGYYDNTDIGKNLINLYNN